MIEKFIEYISTNRRLSENTIEGYENDIYKFKNFLDNNKLNYLNLSYNDVTKYVMYLNDRKLSSTTINRNLSSIRSLYNYIMKLKIISSNPFLLVKGPKIEKKLPNFLNYNEYLDLFSTCDDTNLGIRNKMILELLFATGIRVSEAVNIRLRDIDFKGLEIKVLGKGNKSRIVYFSKYCQKLMSEYVLNARQEILKGSTNEYLLINHLGNKLTRRGIADIIDRLVKKSAIKHKISPHVLRHTFATQMLNNGMDIREVQILLGHDSIGTTSIYTHVSNEELRKVYLKCLPR